MTFNLRTNPSIFWSDNVSSAVMPPLTNGLELFLDLTSPDTIISGTTVAQIGDRSGFGRHFSQSSAGNRPFFNVSDPNYGYKPSMVFDGTSDYLVNGGIKWSGNTATVYTVFNTFVNNNPDQRIISTQVNMFGGTFTHQISASIYRSFVTNPSGSNSIRSSSFTANTTNRIACVINLSNSLNNNPAMYVNNILTGTTTSGASSGVTWSMAPYGIGATNVGGSTFSGSIATILVFSGMHTRDEVNVMDSWLRGIYNL